jgi:hypothetical protein
VTSIGLDTSAILAVARLRDPIGILSVYVDAEPRQGEGRDAAAVALRNALRELERAAHEDASHERRSALRECLERLEPEIEELLSPRLHGRGRALFAQVEGDAVHRVTVQAAFPTEVVLGERASLRPLLAPLAASRPAGVAVVSRAAVRVIEWRPSQPEEIASYSLEPEIEEWREPGGRPDTGRPAPGRGRLSQQSAAQDDRFARLLEQERKRLLRPIAANVATVAADRGWNLVVVAGDEEVAEPLVAGLPVNGSFETLRHAALLGEYLSPAEVADALAGVVAQARERQAHALAERAKEAALAGGSGAVGLEDTLDALLEGRVHELMLDPEREHEGVEAPDGRLFPAGVVPAGLDPSDLRPEPRLVDRMIERALETDVAVVPLVGAAAESLRDFNGVAAILRW